MAQIKQASEGTAPAPEVRVAESSSAKKEPLGGRAHTAGTRTSFVRSASLRYLLAVPAVGLALLVRVALAPYGQLPPYTTFYPFVLLVAMLGGIWAGLLTTGLCALVAIYWLLPPIGEHAINSTSGAISVVIFCTTGVSVSVVAELYNRKRDRLATANAQLRAEITERKRVEDVLHLSKAKFAKAFANNPGAVGITRLKDGVFLEVNDTWVELVGYSREEMIGRSSRRMIWPTREATVRCLRRLRQKGSLRGWEQEFLKKSGEVFVTELSAQIWIHNGKKLVVTTLIDITARKRAETALRDSEKRLWQFIEHAPAALAVFDHEMHYICASRRWMSDYKLGDHDLRGTLHYDVFPEIGKEWKEAHRRGLAGEVTSSEGDRFERADGSVQWVRWEIRPWYNAAGEVGGILIHADDITERKRAEEALLQSEKLISLGRMAATIAHEINNPLAAVMNLLFLANSTKDLPESAHHLLETADSELKRVAHIARQSLGFYRESNAPTLTCVNALLDSAVDLLKSRIKAKHAVVERQWDSDVQITAIAGELRQVFSNLVSNSLDAIDERGTVKLRVSTGNQRVRITVADNGRGIPPSTLQHIFEPFFTTKDAVGTGLGLWVSQQLIDKHGGTIRVRSHSDGLRRGTTFSVVLPVGPMPAVTS